MAELEIQLVGVKELAKGRNSTVKELLHLIKGIAIVQCLHTASIVIFFC